MSILPENPHDQLLDRNVNPKHWPKLPYRDVYDFIAIGGGTAGLVATGGAAMLGASVALIERERLGGDCLVTGCVPSKALIHAADAVDKARKLKEIGIDTGPITVDFPAVMENLRRRRAQISHDDSALSVSDRGVELLHGTARFSSPNTIELNGQTIRFKRAIICTGSRPRMPQISGLAESNPLTSDTVFNLTKLPKRLAVIGTGPIGCELGQAFARLGSEVTLIGSRQNVLPHDDPSAGEILAKQLADDGVQLILKANTRKVSKSKNGYTIEGESNGEPWSIETDKILVATGRIPNIESLNLEAAGIDYSKQGVAVDSFQRTSNKRVYAAGDISGQEMFTHAAYAYAEYATLNALAPVRFFKSSQRHIPHATYTTPEVAHIGPSWEELQNRIESLDCYSERFSAVDRSKIEGAAEGFVKIYTDRGKDKIVAATIVGLQAGELIGHISLGMTAKIGLEKLGLTVFPYPTRAEIIRKAADQYMFRKLTPFAKRLAKCWFRLMR